MLSWSRVAVASTRLVSLRASGTSPCSNIYSVITRDNARKESLVSVPVSHEYVCDGRPIHPIVGRLTWQTPAVPRSRSSDTYGLVEVHARLGHVSGDKQVRNNKTFCGAHATAGSW
jgi:hypothetical protein